MCGKSFHHVRIKGSLPSLCWSLKRGEWPLPCHLGGRWPGDGPCSPGWTAPLTLASTHSRGPGGMGVWPEQTGLRNCRTWEPRSASRPSHMVSVTDGAAEWRAAALLFVTAPLAAAPPAGRVRRKDGRTRRDVACPRDLWRPCCPALPSS